MKVSFKKGFTVYYGERKEPIIICPHSGPALESTTSRDDNSETTASLLWRKMNGKLVIANVSRKRLWGVDFNRDIPPTKKAIESYNVFIKNTDLPVMIDYQKKYGWVAKDEEDYEERLKIYQGFWGEVEDENTIIFIHRQFNRLKSLPGLMDFISLAGKGIKKEKVYEVILESNVKYGEFFRRIEPGYKQAVLFETERLVAEAIKKHKVFDWGKFNLSTRGIFFRDLKVIKKYAEPYLIKRLEAKFTAENYLESAKNALKNSPCPRMTIENVFDGSLAHGPRRKLFTGKNKIVMEVEPSHFMNLWYPEETAIIIKDVIEKLMK